MQIRSLVAAIAVPIIVMATVGVGGWWVSRSAPDQRPPIAEALNSVPADAQVIGFTDWSAIRTALGAGENPSPAELTVLSDDAALRDLSTRSVLGQTVATMDVAFGWSAADLKWEAYSQATDGAAMVARLDAGVSTDDVTAGLQDLGYLESDGVWLAPENLSATAGPELVDTLGVVAVDATRDLVVASNEAAYVRLVVDVVSGGAPSLLDTRAAADVAHGLSGVTTGLIESGRYACDTASLSSLGQTVRDQADAALTRSGPLSRVEFGGRGVVDDGRDVQTVRFSMAFADPTVATAQVPVREQLARGPFIGRNGQMEDVLQLSGTKVKGSALTMSFAHDPDSAAFMVGKGPLLFASCPV